MLKSALTAFALFGFAAVAHAQAGGCPTPGALSGEWQGMYTQGDGAVPFDLRLREATREIAGSIVEPNAIGDLSQSLFLTATFTGTRQGCQINFVKTYSGLGGQNHSVTYQGTVDRTGNRITGVYEGGAGRFDLVRLP